MSYFKLNYFMVPKQALRFSFVLFIGGLGKIENKTNIFYFSNDLA